MNQITSIIDLLGNSQIMSGNQFHFQTHQDNKSSVGMTGLDSLSPNKFGFGSKDRMTELKNRSLRSGLVFQGTESPNQSEIKALSELKKRSPSVVIHGNNVTQVFVEKKSFGTIPSTNGLQQHLRKSPSPNTELN